MHSVPSPSASKPQISDYTRIRARSIRFLILLAAVLALAFFLSLRAGSYNTPAAELIRGIFGRAADNKINLVIRNNRLPRICTAMVAGAGLGLAGCILQAVLRNPLASASTLGVSQGATFGAAVAIIGLGLSQAGSWAIPLCSFLGSLPGAQRQKERERQNGRQQDQKADASGAVAAVVGIVRLTRRV